MPPVAPPLISVGFPNLGQLWALSKKIISNHFGAEKRLDFRLTLEGKSLEMQTFLRGCAPIFWNSSISHYKQIPGNASLCIKNYTVHTSMRYNTLYET